MRKHNPQHAARKAGEAKKQAARRKDGKGKDRVAASRARAAAKR